eukprot:gene5988-7460_t
MSLKNTHKLAGSIKENKVRTITKLPTNNGEVVTNYTQKDVRPIFQKASFPIFLDFSEGFYQLESDDFLKACTNIVKELNLSSNSLIEIISLSHLTKLKRLILDKNNLVEVSLQGLSSLVYLGLCNNRLDHLSDSLADCKKLLNIDLSGNRLTDGFDHLSKLKSIKVIDLSSNGISMTISEFTKKVLEPLKKVKTLEYISFESNPVEKSIDEFRLYVINELHKIKYLDWVLITKEERSKASKLESEGFWTKQLQQTAALKASTSNGSLSNLYPPSNNNSSNNLSTSPPPTVNIVSTPPKPILQQQHSSSSQFVQRKPSVGINMSPKMGSSSLSRSSELSLQFQQQQSQLPPPSPSSLSSSGDLRKDLAHHQHNQSLNQSTDQLKDSSDSISSSSMSSLSMDHHISSSPKSSVPLKGRRLSITGSTDAVPAPGSTPPTKDIVTDKPKVDAQMFDLAESFGVKNRSLSLSTKNNSNGSPAKPPAVSNPTSIPTTIHEEEKILIQPPPPDSAAVANNRNSTNNISTNLILSGIKSAKDLTKEETESYLDQILNDFPSVDNPNINYDLASVIDQKIYLDLLYRAIVEDSVPPELLESSSIILKPSSQPIVSPIVIDTSADEIVQQPPPSLPAITTSPLGPVPLELNMEDDEVIQVMDDDSFIKVPTEPVNVPVEIVPMARDKLVPNIDNNNNNYNQNNNVSKAIQDIVSQPPKETITTTTTTTTNTTNSFSSAKDMWVKVSNESTAAAAANNTPIKSTPPQPIKPNLKPSVNDSTPRSSPTSSSPVKAPIVKPPPFSVKKSSPSTTPISSSPVNSTPLVSSAPKDISSTGVPKPSILKPAPTTTTPTVNKPPVAPTPVIEKQTPAPTPKPVEKSTITTTTTNENKSPVPVGSKGELDINQFNLEIEAALKDIEISYQADMDTIEEKIAEKKKSNSNTPPSSTSPILTPKSELPPSVPVVPPASLTTPITKVTPPAPKPALPTNQSFIEQVENATSKLDEMIQNYNDDEQVKAPVTIQPTTIKSVTGSTPKSPISPALSSTSSKSFGEDDDMLDKLISNFENETISKPVSPASATATSSPLSGTFKQGYQTSNTPLPPLQNWVIPYGDIQMGNKLGMGVFGDCFTGRTPSRPVILKKLRTQRFADQFLNQFKEEVNQIRELQHENIIPVIGCCVDTTIFVVHPYYETTSLQQLLDDPTFNITNEFILKVSHSVSKGMCYLQQHDIIHRSLKPNNILIEKSTGNVLIRDFAFASIKDAAFRAGQVGNPYMAPELFSSSCSSYDSSSDQYSYGLIVWQMFSRSQPFPNISPNRLPEIITSGARPDIPSNMPSVFDRLVRACWNPDPHSRPTFLTISKILSQPIQRLFSMPSPPTNSSAAPLKSVPVAPTVNIQNTTSAAAKHQFSETGDLQRKMSLVLEKIVGMLGGDRELAAKSLKALENLSSPDNHQHMIGVGLMAHLIRLMEREDLQEQALRVLYTLCINESLSNEFIQTDGLIVLVKLMNSDNTTICLSSIKLLTALADEQHLEQIRTSGALKILLRSLQTNNELIVMQTVSALSRVLLDVNNQAYFIECGTISILLEMLKSSHSGLSMRALLALCCFITNEKCNDQLLNAGIVPKLMDLLGSPQKLLRMHTLKIVQNISIDNKFREILIQENAIQLLTEQISTSSQDAIHVVLSCLSSLLKSPSSHNAFFQCQGVDKVISLINPSRQTSDILQSSLSVVYSIIPHDLSRNKLRLLIPKLVEFLTRINDSSIDNQVIVQILQCLSSFSTHMSCIGALQQTMCVSVIVSLLRNNNNSDVKLYSLRLISSLSKIGTEFTLSIYSSGLLPMLADFLLDKNISIKEESISAISWLSSSNECRALFLSKGVLKSLLYYNTKNGECIERLLWSISFFAIDEPAQAVMRESNVFEFIVQNLAREEEVLRTLAIKTILILSQKPLNREPLKRARITPYLRQLENSPNRSVSLASKKVLSLLEQQ